MSVDSAMAVRAPRYGLEEIEDIYYALIEAAPDLVWIANAHGKPEYVNGHWEAYTGYSLERLNAEGWQALDHADDVTLLESGWNDATYKGIPFTAEFRYRRHDGAYRWFVGRAVPLKDERGNVSRWVGIMTDIDGHRQLEESLRAKAAALEATAKEKEDLVATLAHRLRNPLAPIRYAAAIITREASPEKLAQAGETIERNVRIMANLLESLLDAGGVDAGSSSAVSDLNPGKRPQG